MKVLVTGSTGFLGTVLVERLLAHGEKDIRCFVRSGSNRKALDALMARYPDARVELFVGTLGTVDGCAAALEGVGVVYHLAAALAGPAADIFLNTVVASKNLLEAIVRMQHKPRVVLVSSFGVYGVAERGRGFLVDESAPLEPHPERRDLYSAAKLRQERLFWEYREKHGLDLVVLRPGVIYGPRGGAFSARVGIKLFGVFFHLGGDNVLPLSFVENCAEAIVVAGQSPKSSGEVYNVHDDDLPDCTTYMREYRRQVGPIRSLRVPYLAMLAASSALLAYNKYSKGQLPAVFTPYKTKTSWGGNRFDNSKLKSLGWHQIVSTEEGMRRTFEHVKANPK